MFFFLSVNTRQRQNKIICVNHIRIKNSSGIDYSSPVYCWNYEIYAKQYNATIRYKEAKGNV